MTAIILTPTQAESLLASIRATYQARDMQPYWLPYPLPITSGPHTGKCAIDVGPAALNMVMINDLTLAQLPDFQAIMAGLGNPDPVELTDEEILQPAPIGLTLP
jgi:hypothetical protein